MKPPLDKWAIAALIFNTVVWVVFWTYFIWTGAVATPAEGTGWDLVHTWGLRHLDFWGYRLEPPNSVFDSAVWVFTVFVELPSMFVSAFARRGLEHAFGHEATFAGMNLLAWQFVGAVLLSYVQWCFLARLLRWGWTRLKKG